MTAARDVSRWTSLALFALALTTGAIGVTWGLPSHARSGLYPGALSWYDQAQTSQRLYTTAPFDSFHPDEGGILNALSNMSPGELDFNPRFFNYPSLWIYTTGAALAAAERLGLVELQNSKRYYLERPDAMARLYVAGRLPAVLISAIGVVLTAWTATRLFGSTGWLAGLLLAVTPLWARDAHFLLVNVPAAAFGTGAAYCAATALVTPSRAWLLASGLLAGLAASTKYPAGAVLLLPLSVVVWRRSELASPFRLCLGIGGVAALAFIAGTPYALVTPAAWFHDVAFEGQDKLGWPGSVEIVRQLFVGLGTPLAIAAIAGATLALRHRSDERYAFLALWLATGLVQRAISDAPYLRYLVAALPALAVAAAIALLRPGVTTGGRTRRRLALAATVIVVGWTAAYTAGAVGAMTGEDVRVTAGRWVANCLPASAAVGVPGSLWYDAAPLNAERFRVVDLRVAGTTPDWVVVPRTRADGAARWLQAVGATDGGAVTALSLDQGPGTGWSWPVTARYNDWAYTNHAIAVLRRPGAAAVPGAGDACAATSR